MSRRFPWYAALALTLAGPAAAQTPDAPPSTPTDLVANAYSGTAGGIRWSRSSDDRGPVTGYEVTRDGAVLGVRDALSHVDRALARATTYTYGVTAIDNAGQRSGTATIRLTTRGGLPPGALAAPTGLRSSVYSRTAAEIFWARPATFGLRYEVRRDGGAPVSLNGTSLFDDTLSGGTTYVYDVVAIDREGRRSASSRITLRTRDGGAGSAGPAMPIGLRASVYSRTAAEIFWARTATFGLRHEVRRDGGAPVLVDGTSLFDDTLSGGTTYVYDVVAIDREGRRSASSDVTLTTFGEATPPGGGDPFTEPDPEGTSTIARLGYEATRDLADDLVSATYLELYLDIDDAVDGLHGDPVEEQEIPRSVNCPGGGTASRTLAEDLDRVQRSIFAFDACTVDGRTLSGALERAGSGFPTFGGSTVIDNYTFDDLKIDAGEEGTLVVTGTASRTIIDAGGSCGGGSVPSSATSTLGETSIASARIERGGEVTMVTDAMYSQDDINRVMRAAQDDTCAGIIQTLGFEGTASVESTRFGDGRAMLAKRGEIVRDYREGMSSAAASLTADFGDDSALAVTTTSDEAGEVQVDIVSDGAAVSFTDSYRFEPR